MGQARGEATEEEVEEVSSLGERMSDPTLRIGQEYSTRYPRVGEALQNWWANQERFRSKAHLARDLGISNQSVVDYFRGRQFPKMEYRERLYKLTGHECFAPDAQGNPQTDSFRQFSEVPFAREFQNWWVLVGRKQYGTKTRLEEAARINSSMLYNYFAGRCFPYPDQRERLYKITGLACFGPNASMAGNLHRHLLRRPTPWVQDVLVEAHSYTNSIPIKSKTSEIYKKRLCTFASRILNWATQEGLKDLSEITPERLVQIRLYKDKRCERVAFSFFADFLVAEDAWGTQQLQEFKRLLGAHRQLYPGKRPFPQKKRNRNPVFVALVTQLVLRCGLSGDEIRNLRVGQVTPEGIQLRSNHVIPFGETWHCISKVVLVSYLNEAKPQEFLFYRRGRRWHGNRINPDELRIAVKNLNPKLNIQSLRKIHFLQDLYWSKNPKELRLHLRRFHGLGKFHSGKLVCSVVEQTKTFAIPEPFLLALICATRLISGRVKVYEGGKRCWAIWHSLLGHYEVRVEWNKAFAQELVQNPLTGARVAKLLLKLSKTFWIERWRHQPKKRGWLLKEAALHPREQKLLDRLNSTWVKVRDKSTDATWSGALFRFLNHRRSFNIPLVESLEAGSYHSQCIICRHPERRFIEGEIRRMSVRRVAEKCRLSYESLLSHAGKKRGVPGYKGKRLHSHMGWSEPALMLKCPKDFIDRNGRLNPTALILYLLLLAESSSRNDGEIELSPDIIQAQMGLKFTEEELLRGLNSLLVNRMVGPLQRSHGGVLISFLDFTNKISQKPEFRSSPNLPPQLAEI